MTKPRPKPKRRAGKRKPRTWTRWAFIFDRTPFGEPGIRVYWNRAEAAEANAYHESCDVIRRVRITELPS